MRTDKCESAIELTFLDSWGRPDRPNRPQGGWYLLRLAYLVLRDVICPAGDFLRVSWLGRYRVPPKCLRNSGGCCSSLPWNGTSRRDEAWGTEHVRCSLISSA